MSESLSLSFFFLSDDMHNLLLLLLPDQVNQVLGVICGTIIHLLELHFRILVWEHVLGSRVESVHIVRNFCVIGKIKLTISLLSSLNHWLLR